MTPEFFKKWTDYNVYTITRLGYRPIPLYDDNSAAGFGDGQRYDDYRSNEWLKNWEGTQIKHISIALDNCILVDYDGNKASDIISTDVLASMLSITPEELEAAKVQVNDAGDSIHYLFRVSDSDIAEAIRTKTGFKMSNDGHWIQHVDVKTANQLMHVKPHKTLTLPALNELMVAPTALIDVLRAEDTGHVVGEYRECDTEDASALAWLRHDCAELAAMEDGQGRNNKFNEITLLHMSRVAGGYLDEHNTRTALNAAAAACGMVATEIKATMGSASRSAKPVSSVPTHKDVQRSNALELMSGIEGGVPGAVAAISKVAIDLAWDIKNVMENTLNSFQRSDDKAPPFEITINPDVVDHVITRSFWSGAKSKLYVLSDDNALNTYLEKDMIRLLQVHFGRIWVNADIDTACNVIASEMCCDLKPEKIMSKVIAAGMCTITDHLKMMNQRERLDIRVDMFADNPRMEWTQEKVTAVMVWRDLTVGAVEPLRSVIDDYHAHFPEVDDLLAQIVASRFASNRKNFYIWLQCESDWGKGLFTSLLSALGVCVELSVAECEKAFEGAPLGRDASEFNRAFIILFDEFKNVKSELKQLENSLPITPKNQLRQNVELFTKLFTSADAVDSLAGENGVEDQFANRFSYIKGEGSIKNRNMFNDMGQSVYAGHLRNWLAATINVLVQGYIVMGREKAMRHADMFGNEFHERRGIGQRFERMSDALPRMVEDFKKWCIANHSVGKIEGMGAVVREGEFYYLKTASKIFGDWVYETASRSESTTVTKKKSELFKVMSDDDRGVASHRISGSFSKCIKFKLT